MADSNQLDGDFRWQPATFDNPASVLLQKIIFHEIVTR